MKRNILVAIVLALSCLSSFANESKSGNSPQGWCGSIAPSDNWESAFQRQIANYKLNQFSNRNSVAISIPVIVHVIYWTNNTSQNITKAQIDSQIVVLNRNYAGASFYYNNIPAAFKPLVANTGITWCPAKLSQTGAVLAEPGIERINGRNLGWSNPALTGWTKDFIDGTIKPATIWNPDYYCNIWIVPNMTGGIIGYATFPTNTTLDGLGGGNATSTTDGVVIRAMAYGKGGATTAPYNQGGTAAHELGHWLGLRHISGDAACGNDYCDDTPPQSGGNSGGQNGLNYGCATYPFHANGCSGTTGPNGEMFMNYMDYSDDNCTSMFSNDQKTRMLTTMTFGDRRILLQTSTMCDTVLPPPIANFIYNVQSSTLCATSKIVNFTNKTLFYGDTTRVTWSWTFAGGTPATSSVRNPTGIVFNTPGLHDVTLTITNPKGTSTITIQVNVPIIGAGTLPLIEDFEGLDFPPTGWDRVNRNGNPLVNWDIMEGISGYGVGTRCMRFDNTTLDGAFKKDDIMTSKLNFTGVTSATLKFDIAYTPFYGDLGSGTNEYLWDTLEVLITDNCQTTTQSIYRKGETDLATVPAGQGEEFYPTSNQWRTDSIAIPATYLNKPNVQIIFRNYGDYGHTIYLDNINLSVPNAAPTASFTTSSTSVCQNSSITFTNTSTGSPDSVRWTINGGSPSTSTSNTTVTSAFNTAGTYTVSLVVYKSGTMYGPFSQSVTINAKPTVVANGLAICSGNSASISASGASTYTWNTGATGSTLSVTPTTTTTYTVTGTGSNGCINTDTAIVTVNAKPTVGITNPTPSICAGASASLTGTGATSYSWNTGATTTTVSVSPTTSTTYTVTGTNAAGCINTATATVTVNALPNVTVNNATICLGNSATLSANGATTYSWNTGATGATLTVSPTTTTTYTVTGTGSTGCIKTATATVSVSSTAPTVTLNNTNISVCNGTGVTLTASGADNYSWSTGATGNTISFTPTTTVTVSVSGTLTGCTAAGTATANITVKPNPTVSINNSSSPICAGSSATLGGTGADSYVWNTGATTNSISVSPSTTTTYSVTGTTNGCNGTASATVVVNALPSTAITTSSSAICAGQSTTLTGSGANTYAWNTGETTNSISVSPTTTSTYTLTGTSANGCIKSATQIVQVNPVPAQGSISQNTGSDTLRCSAVAGATYVWFLNGTQIASGANNWIKITQSGSYTVQIVVNNCSSILSTQFNAVYTAIRINSQTIRAWEVYPNPTDGKLIINLNLVKNNNVAIQIYNAVGSEVYVKSYGNVKDINDEVRLDNLATGVYIIKMNVDNETYYHKVVKN